MGLGRRREANRVQAGADIASTAQRREDAVMEAKRAECCSHGRCIQVMDACAEGKAKGP